MTRLDLKASALKMAVHRAGMIGITSGEQSKAWWQTPASETVWSVRQSHSDSSKKRRNIDSDEPVRIDVGPRWIVDTAMRNAASPVLFAVRVQQKLNGIWGTESVIRFVPRELSSARGMKAVKRRPNEEALEQ